MKKVFLILATTSLLISCGDEPNEVEVTKKVTKTFYGLHGHVKPIVEIEHEGCQYIGSFNGTNTDWGTHKGDCNNPIHNTNKVKADTIWGTQTCPVK